MNTQDLRRWRLEAHGARYKVQRPTVTTIREFDRSQQLQSINLIRLDRQDSRTELLSLGKAPLLTQPLSLRERARHI
jgi:hypothetical protein